MVNNQNNCSALTYSVKEHFFLFNLVNLQDVVHTWLLPILPTSGMFIDFSNLILGEFYYICNEEVHEDYPRAEIILAEFITTDLLSNFIYWFTVIAEEIIEEMKIHTGKYLWGGVHIATNGTIILTTTDFIYGS